MQKEPELYCRHRNGLRDIFRERQQDGQKPMPVRIWLAGPPGCGKTRMAMEFFGTDFRSMKQVAMITNLPWFC